MIVIRTILFFCVAILVCLAAHENATAQGETTIARARPVTPSSSRPSSFTIRANILAQKQAAIEQQIVVAQRCIRNASLPTVLRDPEGNIRMVPQTDIVDCTRTLNSLKRQLASLAREADRLAKDAEAAAFSLQSRQQEAQRAARLPRTSTSNR